MFENIKSFFRGEASLRMDEIGEPSSRDLQIATGVLLLNIAGADNDYAPEEVQGIYAMMEDQFNITDQETLSILEEADKLRQEKGRMDEFINAVNKHFSEEQRQLILAMIWKVVIADEMIENYEQRFASELRQCLQLSREQAEVAKQMALEEKV